MKTTTIILISLLFALAQSKTVEEGSYRFTCLADNFALDNENGGTDPGAFLIVYPSDEGGPSYPDNQLYTVKYISGVWATLTNVRSGYTVTVQGTNADALYTHESLTEDDNQLFKFTSTKDGYWIVTNKASGLIITCPDDRITPDADYPAVQGYNTCSSIGKFILTPASEFPTE